jgi:TonB-linked SusC/RagA family outer membrane protein
MKKKLLKPIPHAKSGIKKLLLTMKLALMIIFLSVLQVSANVYSQITVNLDVHNKTIGEVLKTIEQNSQYRFFYNDDLLLMNERIDIQADNKNILSVLDDIFSGSPLTYKTYDNNLIVIAPRQLLQQQKVSGTVKDENGNPLPGVTVVVEGTTTGTVTDVSGKYSIDVPSAKSILKFSFVGYATVKNEANKTIIDVSMVPESKMLDEVVVIGYGAQKKANLTGVVETVSGKQLSGRTGANLSSMMAGNVAGLTVVQSSGQPGNDNGAFHIRGIGTIRDDLNGSGVTPMVIIDGVEGNMNTVPVEDIESVSVLADAASSAIYGVRAANGVILITTKRGKAGKTTINYHGYTGFDSPTVLPKWVNSADYCTIYDLAKANDSPGAVVPYSDADIAKYRAGTDPAYPNTNWQDELLKKSASKQGHYLSMTGGSENTQYMVSLDYLKEGGLIANTNYNRYALRTNIDHSLNKNVKIGLNLSYLNDKALQPTSVEIPGGASLGSGLYKLRERAWDTPPIYPVRWPNGNWYAYQNQLNPVAQAEDGGSFTGFNRTFMATLYTEIQLLKGLKYKITGSFSDVNLRNKNLIKSLPLYSAPTTLAITLRSSVDEKWENLSVLDVTNLLTYEHSFGKHNLSALLGQNVRKTDDTSVEGFKYDLPANNSVDQLDDGNASTAITNGNLIQYRLESYFGRAQYNYAERYLFEANLRYDGTTRFPKNNRWGMFPSFSAAWRVSQEGFMKAVPSISNLKLRASWGQLGNQEIGNYAFQGTYVFGRLYPFGSSYATTVVENATLPNTNITWEVTTKRNVGVDIGLFGGKIDLSADYFNDLTSDILLYLPQPKILGGNPPYMNAGKVKNNGFALKANYKNQTGGFDYYVGGNFTYTHNEITYLAGGDVPGRSVGDPVNNIYGYKCLGIFQSQAEIDAAPDQSGLLGTPQPGDLRYADISGPEGKPDGKVDSNDRASLGSNFPKINYGINAGCSFKGFDFSILLQGVAKVDFVLPSYGTLGTTGSYFPELMNSWDFNKTSPSYPRLSFNTTNAYLGHLSSYFVKDASYLKCRNIQLGYTLPEKALKSICKIRVYTSCDNAFTLTKVKYWDPENQGVTQHPYMRSISFGANVTF